LVGEVEGAILVAPNQVRESLALTLFRPLDQLAIVLGFAVFARRFGPSPPLYA
jgi:hypothetical protein